MRKGFSIFTAIVVLIAVLLFTTWWEGDKPEEKKTPSAKKEMTHEEKCDFYREKYNRNMRNIKEYALQGRSKLSHLSNVEAGKYQEKLVNECGAVFK